MENQSSTNSPATRKTPAMKIWAYGRLPWLMLIFTRRRVQIRAPIEAFVQEHGFELPKI
jgi:hypothetical protein